MHPFALRDELDLDEAARLIASENGGDAAIPGWRQRLDEFHERGKLPTHDRAVPFPWFFLGDPRPLETYNKPHVKKEDLQRLCAKHGITSPYGGLPPPTIEEQRLVDLEQVCAEQNDATLRSWEKRHVLAALAARPLFAELAPSSLDTFWKDAGRERFQAIQAQRVGKKKP